MKAKEFIIELKKQSKPRNFVAKNASLAGKAGQHKDKKKAEKQGDVKHKKEIAAMESALSELSTEKLAQYKKAAGADAKKSDADGNYSRGDKRFKGINRATNKQFDNDLKKHGVAEASLGNYREKALKQKAQSQMGAMFNNDPEKQKQDLATFNKRERGLNRLKARDEVARKNTADKQMADNIAKLPELKAEYERMKAEYKSLGGSNWQYADREQNLTDRERQARSMEGPMNNLWRTISAAEKAQKSQGVAEGSLNEFAPGGNSASSYYAVTANFVNDFAQQKQEELQDLIDAGWTKQDLAQAGTLQSQAADIVHFEQVRDGFLKGLKPGFDAYLQGDTQLKDQLGSYWQENDLPLNQDWEKIYGEPWGRDEYDEGVAENIKVEPVAKSLRIQNTQTQPNNFAVYINGKKWKVFKGRGRYADDQREQAHYQQLKDWAAKKSVSSGKQWTVSITGETATESVEEASKVPFGGAKVGHKEGPAGQWRNDGAKKNKPAKPGDLVGSGM